MHYTQAAMDRAQDRIAALQARVEELEAFPVDCYNADHGDECNTMGKHLAALARSAKRGG